MSIFSKIGSVLKGAVGGFLGGGPIGAVIGGAAGALGGGGGGGGMRPPTTYAGGMGGMRGLPGGGLGGMRTLPGRGAMRIPTINIRKALPTIGKVAGGAAAAKYAYDAYGNLTQVRPRRRRKGITASELKGFKRVACILRDYQKVAVKTHTKAPARRSRTCA